MIFLRFKSVISSVNLVISSVNLVIPSFSFAIFIILTAFLNLPFAQPPPCKGL